MGNILDYRTITFFDVETTSLDPLSGEIIQIAIITEDRSGRLTEWSTKIKPRLKRGTYSPKALEINGYSDEDWADAPHFAEVADTIVEKLRWRKASAMGYKSHTNFDEKLFRLGYPVIDTVSLAWLSMPSERQSLQVLREHLGISQDGAHEAVKDVYDCRSVFWHCAEKIIDTF